MEHLSPNLQSDNLTKMASLFTHLYPPTHLFGQTDTLTTNTSVQAMDTPELYIERGALVKEYSLNTPTTKTLLTK